MRIAGLFREIGIVAWSAVRPAVWVAAAIATGALVTPSHAQQGRVDARYSVTLAGIPIGKGSWVIDISEDQFTAAASGATSGLLRVFASGQGSGASRGFIVSGTPVPASFAASITSDTKTEEIRMTLNSGDVKTYVISPEPTPDPERVPVKDAHRRGVSDPMTASLIRVPGNGELLGPQACPRKVSVFDGRMRYDLQLSYKRLDKVKAEKGYAWPVVVCSVHFLPVAGYIPSRSAISYLISLKDIEAWFAPVGATRVLVPYRVSVPTPIGVGVMEATQFITVAQSRRSVARSRTQ
jgi:hypothetical protein